MDEFYNELYGDLIFEWIKTLCFKYQFPDVSQKEEDMYKKASIKKEDYHGSVTLWLKEHIIEEEIKDKDNHTIFYLHYNIVSLKQCYSFIHDFFRAFINFLELSHTRVLLCCSGGLSTSLFSYHLQEVADSYHLPITFSAVGVTELKDVFHKYDIILLAPQIAYMQSTIAQYKTNDKQKIICISPNDFATQNYHQLVLEIVDRNLT